MSDQTSAFISLGESKIITITFYQTLRKSQDLGLLRDAFGAQKPPQVGTLGDGKRVRFQRGVPRGSRVSFLIDFRMYFEVFFAVFLHKSVLKYSEMIGPRGMGILWEWDGKCVFWHTYLLFLYVLLIYPHFEIFKIDWVSGHGNTMGASRERHTPGTVWEWHGNIRGRSWE